MTPGSGRPVIVVGGGLSGVACARRLHAAGLPVRLLERAHRLGGRMATRTEQWHGRPHPVDIGAPYITVRDPRFTQVVAGLEAAGLARKWTDTFTLAGPYGRSGESSGTQRWSAAGGLRSLVEALAIGAGDVAGFDVQLETTVSRVEVGPDGVPTVDGVAAAAVVLAMPDPQAARLLDAELADRLKVSDRGWSPVVTVWAGWPQRWWPDLDGMFVHDSDVVSWVADSGRSRGDGAAVLVAHATPEFAAQHLPDPTSAIEPVMAELRHVLGEPVPPPEWQRAHRWSLASARETHPEPFLLLDDLAGGGPTGIGGEGLIGVCGDAWGPRSRVEQAWMSGDGLAGELLQRLAVSS